MRKRLLAPWLIGLCLCPALGCTGQNPDYQTPLDLAGVAPGADLSGGGGTVDLSDPVNVGTLSASPGELVFSSVRGSSPAAQSVTLTARGGTVTVSGVASDGSAAAAFAPDTPALPTSLTDGQSLTVPVRFAPAGNQVGALAARLQVTYGPRAAGPLVVGLYGLSTQGQFGNNEPTLQQVVNTLGYPTNVGGNSLNLSTGTNPIGDEVNSQVFRRAAPGEIALRPVARYSNTGQVAFGIYAAALPNQRRQFGVLKDGNDAAQTLYPPLEVGASLTVDPGADLRFGVYVTTSTKTMFSEDRLNTNNVIRHASRVYSVKDRSGVTLANQYLVTFEEASNGDYQDYVFLLTNVTLP